jgi:hypothetical protein
VTGGGGSVYIAYSINCHTPLFSCANVVAVSRILVWNGAARGLKASPRTGEARYERHPKWERRFADEIILDMSVAVLSLESWN